METTALLLKEPRQLDLAALRLIDPAEGDVVVETRWSGISTGTERLFWLGTMPPFPGMGYPLVPGYETVGEVVEAGPDADHRPGDFVFVPGARCYSDARALFGGSASRLVVSAVKAVTVDRELKEDAALMALAATAYHAMAGSFGRQPMLIVGHGVLGRLLARLASLLGGEPPVVWERDPRRRDGAEGYAVIDPAEDERRDYQTVFDVSVEARQYDLAARTEPGDQRIEQRGVAR
ncbi:MAG: chlorophyll synthesis pathway protein BchC, partial [Pseudomonadota bacterium]